MLRGHYEDVIVDLVRSGVDVRIRYRQEGTLSAVRYAETLRRRGCVIGLAQLPERGSNASDRFALRLRQLANVLRFYHRDFLGRKWIREEKVSRAKPGPRRLGRMIGSLGPAVAMAAIRVIRGVDSLLPPASLAFTVLNDERPDALVAVPVIRTPEFVDFLKAAARRRIPSASWVQSWDNLSSKGLLHFVPDRVFVWNEVQRVELERYHGVPRSRVCITGAQTFDHWFNGDEPLDRAAFCAENGLSADRPIILYLVSSRLLEPSPDVFFARWLDAVRASDHVGLRNASVFVRPHPTNIAPWAEIEEGRPGVARSYSVGEAELNSSAFRSGYRNELFHATVAVALNTSGMIDAAIFGKAVCTVELPELEYGQRGLVHFEYLKTISGGLLRTARTLDEHVQTLAALIDRDPYMHDEQSLRFIETFVRPQGLSVEPARVFADAMRALLESTSALAPPGLLGRAVGRVLAAAAPVLAAPLEPDLTAHLRHRSRKRLRKARKRARIWAHGTRKQALRRRKRLWRRLRRGRRLVRALRPSRPAGVRDNR